MLLPDVDNNVPSPAGSYEILRRDVGLAPGELASTLWRNPDPFEDSSPLNLRIFTKLIRVSSLFVRACEGVYTSFFPLFIGLLEIRRSLLPSRRPSVASARTGLDQPQPRLNSTGLNTAL
ncbi:hypothetical protein Y032_0081g1437 [Ancylostoma ceylanicum]|uniref:Uncharacterized protein n=1 Tax=Ancylostoma ceylanicum TaxID=53326 RepID=A0A016TS26_9BILA|nr:hypothetical protein Y032_0081g1437 [Ancylostoma ceylanicum]